MLQHMTKIALAFCALGSLLVLISCSGDDDGLADTVDLNISPATNANAGTSFTNQSNVDIRVEYFWAVSGGPGNGDLRDAIAYIDANHDGLTDIFMATGEYLLEGEVDCILGLNNGDGTFTQTTEPFGGDMPPATHARKSVVADFDNNGLDDIFVFDHGFDADPFPGSNPKLIMQDARGTFSWTKLTDQTGFHHGGAAADIDNDGDMDVFVGGNDPFFYINDGRGNFEMVTDRYDGSMNQIFTVELIDVDEDGFVDLLTGQDDQADLSTMIYWGNSTGSYTMANSTIIPPFTNYGTVLDFDAADFDGDGDLDLVVNRTGGGANFYVGRQVQLLLQDNRQFSDATSQINVSGDPSGIWFPWIRVQDVDNDGDIDFLPDDLSFPWSYINDGNGNFTLTE